MSSLFAGRLNRHQRRRVEALAPAVDRVTAGDAAFFKRFPQRSHRLRLLSAAELEQMKAAGGIDSAKPGERWATAVRQVAPGARLRRFFTIEEGADLDLTEATCARVFDELTSGSDLAARIENDLREIMKTHGGGAH